jgi:two-component system OmpR family sensor kinase
MLRSLQSRLFFSYLLITGFMLILMILGLVVLFRNNPLVDQVTYRRLELGLPLISRRQGSSILEMGPRELDQAIERLDLLLGERVFLLGPDGQVVEDSRPALPEIPAYVSSDAVQQADLYRGRYEDGNGTQWLFVTQGLEQGYVLVVATQRPVIRMLAALLGDDLLRPLFQAGLASLALSILLSFLIARWIAKPLDRMAQAARAVAAGEFKRDLRTTGPQEVESLAIAFNEMIHQVENSQNSQRDFVANVSHELKTPLTSIQGFAQAILDGTAEDTDSLQHAAQVIFDESNRLKRLVEDLLDLARIDAGQIDFRRDRVDLKAIIANVSDRLGLRAREAEVEIQELLPALPPMIGDGDRLAQVFTNLVDNAIEHSPADGLVRIWGETSQGWVSIHVEDEGPGIPAHELSRIFERFYQMDKARSSRGVGLGLPISREIIRNHQGELSAASEVGRGSRFTVRLPLVRSDDSTLKRPIRQEIEFP